MQLSFYKAVYKFMKLNAITSLACALFLTSLGYGQAQTAASTSTSATPPPTTSTPPPPAAPAPTADKKKEKKELTPEEAADKRLADLNKKLTLTDDEQAKIKPLLLDEATKDAALQEDTTVDSKDKKAQAKDLKKYVDDQIALLLTDDQKKIFEKQEAGKKKS